MIMTPEEQKDMLDMIKSMKTLSKQKSELMREIVLTAQALAIENAVLRNENENLKRQLEIAEKAILRSNEPQS